MKLIIRWAISALSLFVAAWFVTGIRVDDGGGWVVYAAMAVILGLVNAFVRPLLKLLTCPLILAHTRPVHTRGERCDLAVGGRSGEHVFHVGFYVDGFWPAFWGALIVSVVSVVLNVFIKDDDKKDKQHKH